MGEGQSDLSFSHREKVPEGRMRGGYFGTRYTTALMCIPAPTDANTTMSPAASACSRIFPLQIRSSIVGIVATVPTLLDLIAKNQLDGYAFHPGEIVLFASVGAGMHINAFVYRMG